MENSMRKNKNVLIITSIAPILTEKGSFKFAHITQFRNVHNSIYHSDAPSIWLCFDGEFILHTEHGDIRCARGNVVIIPAGTMYYPEAIAGSELSVGHISMHYDAYKNVNHAAYIRSITHLLLPAFSKELGFCPARTLMLSETSFEEAKNLISSPSLSSIEKFFSLPEFPLSRKERDKALSVISNRLLPVLDAMVYIHENYPQKITGEDLAESSGLCRTNLFIFFKRYLGVSPLTYLVMIRVTRAQFALTHTQYSLQYISDVCGFANCSHMSRCYRQYKGLLPSDDRAKMKIYRQKYPNVHVSHNFF